MDFNREIGQFEMSVGEFFAQFAQNILKNILKQQSLIKSLPVEQIIEKIEEQPSFSKAPKFQKDEENASPGPAKYLNNIYDTSNMKERIEALTGNNRFNTKLFRRLGFRKRLGFRNYRKFRRNTRYI